MLKSAMFAAAAALAAPTVCLADDPPLTIGDTAPAIDITHWLKGEPIEAYEEGKVYVLEFWATWCGPCVAAMPHLSELQKEYKDYDVTFIGVSDEPLQTVVDFLFKEYPRDGKIQNDRTQYTLTTDPDKSVFNDYFKAAGRSGIPCTFIVGKTGEIEFIGHPMSMDEPLEKVVRDEWDRDAFKTTYEEGMKVMRIQNKAFEAMGEGRLDDAVKIWDEVLALDPDNLNALMTKMRIHLVEQKDFERGYALAAEIVENNQDNANLLNTVAWMIVDEDLAERDLDLAIRASTRSNELTDNENAANLDTLAMIHYRNGDLAEALKWQELAAKFADDGPLGEEIRGRLEKFRSEKD